MERKHDWKKCTFSIYRCNVCKAFDMINIIDEETTPEEILQQRQDIFNRIDCSGEEYK